MADQELLFSLLRFVALVTPAMAIFLQLLASTGETDSPVFRAIEFAIFGSVVGAGIILLQLLGQIEDSITQIGTLFIFGSLLFLAAGVGWRVIPFTDNISVSATSPRDAFTIAIKLVGLVIVFTIPFVPPLLLFFADINRLNELLNFGFIQTTDILTPKLFFIIVFTVAAARFDLYLADVGYISEYTLNEAFEESVGATIAGHLVTLLFIAPTFISAYILTFLLDYILNIDGSYWFFSVAYLWTNLLIVIIFFIDLWGEKEAENRLAADDPEE